MGQTSYTASNKDFRKYIYSEWCIYISCVPNYNLTKNSIGIPLKHIQFIVKWIPQICVILPFTSLSLVLLAVSPWDYPTRFHKKRIVPGELATTEAVVSKALKAS